MSFFNVLLKLIEDVANFTSETTSLAGLYQPETPHSLVKSEDKKVGWLFHNLADDIVFLLIKNKKIDIHKRDIYVYGIEILLLNSSLLIIFLILSVLLNSLKIFGMYLLFFIPLRIFTGGFHAKTSEQCFVLSILMYCLSVYTANSFPCWFRNVEFCFCGVIAVIIIIVFSPLINVNNPLNINQQKRNKTIVILLLLFDFVFFIVCFFLNLEIGTYVVMFVILDAILLIIGKIVSILENNQI